MSSQDILPDVLTPNLKLVICGSAVSKQSNIAGSYYAGQGNKFWQILCDTHLTDRVLRTCEYRRLLDYGIGLTDVAKKAAVSTLTFNTTIMTPLTLHQKWSASNPESSVSTEKKRLLFSGPGNMA